VTDLTADERKLLPLFTAMFLRSHAFLSNQTNLVPPFPDCHECGQPVAKVVNQEKHFPTMKAWTLLKPCEHRIELTRASAQRIADVAEKAAHQFENQPRGSAPDWLRGGVCCGCQGAGGPVVYRNSNDQTFCSHCCECDCRTIPCSKPEAPVLTAEEARAEVDRLNYELYQARDALAYVAECCTNAEREQRPITIADVRTWLKGAQCGRQLLAEQEELAHGPEEES
jgi:hypothetical protein